jgi:hypothetical protein
VREHRDAAAAAKQHTSGGHSKKVAKEIKPRTAQTFNLTTYKFHALGDYVHAIQMFGTVDGFTMQLVCNLLPKNATVNLPA